jgi:hypothetical protein
MARNNGQWYIEQNDEGQYSAKKGGAKRASTVEDTQRDAIERAKAIDPNAHINIDRVRDTNRGERDKWRSE